MIEKINFHNRTYQLVRNDDRYFDDNVFTIIVGKNGTGKSTLLSSIVSGLLINYHERFFNNHEIGFRNFAYSDIQLNHLPDAIIAVSSSPFDKFPLTKKFNDVDTYTYLGLRDLSSLNFGLSYMSKIISSLIESIYNNPAHWENLSDVLDYLGYRDHISAKFVFNLNRDSIEEILSDNFNFEEYFKNRFSLKSLNKRFFHNEFGEIEHGKVNFLRETLHEIINDNEFRPNRLINISINHQGINIETNNTRLHSEQIIFLLHAGILKLRDIGLIKTNRDSIYSIKDSSSGEQSVILSILGIASKIKHNSIICIDEPEICLHPEWQEKYIQILIRTFRKFKDCQFIIATHSPQIISNLSDRNCFIVSMEDVEIYNAKNYINNSVDFQLANIFKSPGFKNEYLGRIAYTLFSKVGKNKKFDIEDLENYKILKSIYKSLEDNDPVKDLISVVNELHKKYA